MDFILLSRQMAFEIQLNQPVYCFNQSPSHAKRVQARMTLVNSRESMFMPVFRSEKLLSQNSFLPAFSFALYWVRQ